MADPLPTAHARRIFLSHSGADSDSAKSLAALLRGAGIEVWLDVENLKPGDRWQDEISSGLGRSDAFLLYVGRSGVTRWVDFEVKIALDRAATDANFRLIPVLGPGAEPGALPDFVTKVFHCLDLRDDAQPKPEKLKGLLAGLLDRTPEHVSILPSDRSPFRGLLHFDVDDALLFFGRERETEELLRLLGRDPFLLVVGDSGCGKSSLIRAGLVPALLRGRYHDGRTWVTDWRIAITRPGNDPFGELAETLPDLATELGDRPERVHKNRLLLSEGTAGLRDIVAGSVDSGSRTLLVVDQFEELFTLTKDAAVHRRYIDSLLRAAETGGYRPVHVAVTLRADFFSRCWEFPQLLERAKANQYLTPRLPADGLRELIERPLVLAGATAESGLVEALLDDLGQEPGILALLEHALDQLWQRRRIGSAGAIQITHEAYANVGRLSGALSHHANAALERLQNDEDRALARRFFVAFSQLGEGTEDTRRRVRLDDLVAVAGDRGQAVAVLERLASERLIITSESYGEIAHEALIRSWPKLRIWVDEDRESARRERRLLDMAKEWERLNRDEGSLLRGARLVEAEEWQVSAVPAALPLLQDFIAASLAERQREVTEEKQNRWVELVRLRRNRRLAAGAFAIFIALAAVAALLWKSNLLKQESLLARQLAAQAQQLAIDKPELVESRARLAAESLKREWQLENDQVVRRALGVLAPLVARAGIRGHSASVNVSPDGRWIVIGGGDALLNYGYALVLDASTGKILATLDHDDFVSATSISPDGMRVATASHDMTARLWDTTNGKELARIDHRSPVTSVAYSPDGRYVASGSLDGGVQVWEPGSRKEIVRLQLQGMINSLAFSRDSRWLASGCADGTARVWEASTGIEVTAVKHNEPVASVAFSADGRWVVSGSGGFETSGDARVWEALTGTERARTIHEEGVTSVAFSPESNRVVTGSWDDTARVWEAETGREIARVTHAAAVAMAAFSPDGLRIVSASHDNTARVWEASSGKVISLIEYDGAFTSAVFFPDGQRLAGGTWSRTAGTSAVLVWGALPRHELPRFEHKSTVTSAAYSLDGRLLVSGSEDTTVRLWDVASGKVRTRFAHGATVTSVAFSPDNKLIASSSLDGTVRTWDISLEKEVLKLYHGLPVTSISFSPDSRKIVIGCENGSVRVRDVETGAKIAEFDHGQPITSVLFSIDGRQVFSAGGVLRYKRGEARIWEIATGKEVKGFLQGTGVTSLATSPDGRLMAVGSLSEGARLLDLKSGEETLAASQDASVLSVAFSPTGLRFATGDWAKGARLWETSSGRELAQIDCVGKVVAITFHPAGRWLAIGCGRAVETHAIRPQDLLQLICARMTRNFTLEEWEALLPGEPYERTCLNLP